MNFHDEMNENIDGLESMARGLAYGLRMCYS